MAKLVWDEQNASTGLDRGVIFPNHGEGKVWNGLVSVTENTPTLRERVTYRDGVKVVNQRSEDSYSATVEAFTNPITAEQRALSSGRRLTFGFSYRTRTEKGYQIHLVYNALARPSENKYEIAEQVGFSFDISTKPIHIPGARPSAHLIIDTEFAYPWAITDFEDKLYGSDSETSHIPMPEEVFDIFESHTVLKVIDNLDGTFTVDGPAEAILALDTTTFQITWPSVIQVGDKTYQMRSY